LIALFALTFSERLKEGFEQSCSSILSETWLVLATKEHFLMTRTLAISGSFNKWRIWSIAFVCVMLLLAAALVTGPLHALASPAATGAQVTVNTSQSLGSLTNLSQGINDAVWDSNMLDSSPTTALKSTNVRTVRYPGGSASDVYHWQSNTTVTGQSYANPVNTFDAFMNTDVLPLGAQPIITVNYGSGTPQEAAGWVQYANKGGSNYNGPVPTYSGGSNTGHTYGIKYWEVGNEIYGNGTYGSSWEYDTHAMGPATYATSVVAYSQAMKAADASIKVGAVLTAPGIWPDGQTSASSPQTWNTTVLSTACSSIDFVIAHWYPQNPGSETDAGLLAASSQIASAVSTLRSELTQYCGAHASAIQILITETNSVSSAPGKQSVSTVNALFLADNYLSWLENGVTNVDWWDVHDSPLAGNNNSSSLYGSAQYGSYGVFSTGRCTATNASICEPALDTPLPVYYGLQMLNKLGASGDTMVSSSSNQSLVSVHAVKQANGNLAVLLVNKDPNTTYNVSFALNGYTPASSATVYTYGENSSAITSTQVTGLTSPLTQAIAPYSLTTVVLQPASSPTPTSTPTPTPTPTPGTTPTPTPSPTPTPTPMPTPITSGACQVHYSVNQWSGGFTASLTITNTGTTALNTWSLTFTFPANQQVTQGWGGIFSQQGANVTVSNTSYNGSLPAGSSVNPGFNGSWSGSNPSPTAFSLNGAKCSVS
jgi:alpha-L-arabinofuranosidase